MFLGVAAFIFLVGGGGLLILRALVVALSVVLGGLVITAVGVWAWRRHRRRMLLRSAIPAPLQFQPRTMVTDVTVRALKAANAAAGYSQVPAGERVRAR